MAGSYLHAVDGAGRLWDPEHMSIATETQGDAYETIEEMYGMIWLLASSGGSGTDPRTRVEWARRNYQLGLRLSPGTGSCDVEED